MCVPHVEKHTCTAFEDYEDALKMVPLDFTRYYLSWVTPNVSCASRVLGAEAAELHN